MATYHKEPIFFCINLDFPYGRLHLNHKAIKCDFILNQIIKNLFEKPIIFLIYIYNLVLYLSYITHSGIYSTIILNQKSEKYPYFVIINIILSLSIKLKKLSQIILKDWPF